MSRRRILNSEQKERREWYESMRKKYNEETEEDTVTEHHGSHSPRHKLGIKKTKKSVSSESVLSNSKTYDSLSTQLYDEVSAVKPNFVDKKPTYCPYQKNKSMNASRWIRKLSHCTNPKGVLLCFPGVGGSCNDFMDWSRMLQEDSIDLYSICLPGRLNRLCEPHISSFVHLVGTIVDAFLSLGIPGLAKNVRLCLFGHSVGAILAFEAARLLEKFNFPPVHLIVSSSIAGHALWTKNADKFQIRYSESHENELCQRVIQFGGFPNETLPRKELLMLFLKPIRADYLILEKYVSYFDEEIEHAHIPDFEWEEEEGSVPMLQSTPILAIGAVNDINYRDEPTENGEHFLMGWEIQTQAEFHCWPKFSASKYNWVQQDEEAIRKLTKIIAALCEGNYVFPKVVETVVETVKSSVHAATATLNHDSVQDDDDIRSELTLNTSMSISGKFLDEIDEAGTGGGAAAGAGSSVSSPSVGSRSAGSLSVGRVPTYL